MPLSKPAVRHQIVATVELQLAALRQDDWKRAYSFASTGFRHRIPQDVFVALIMRSYPIVWKNTRGDVGLPRDDGKMARVPVRVFGKEGASADYEYWLVKEAAGWRITGVVPKLPAGPGT